MARLLPHPQVAWPADTRSISNYTALMLLLASVAAVASVIVALCTTHNHRGGAPTSLPKEERTQRRRLVSAFSNSISSKAMLVTKMVSWKKAPEEAETSTGDDALWKKTIIMGEKCRPWNFSGQISYDSVGQMLPENN